MTRTAICLWFPTVLQTDGNKIHSQALNIYAADEFAEPGIHITEPSEPRPSYD